MPKSLEEFYGSQGQSKKKDEDVGLFESALAGVATGLWNIPKGVFSLGATIFDLIGDTNTAKDVEKWFDDINPWDDEAEARTIGKITQAISQIAIPAGYGFKIGSTAAKAWQTKTAADLAKKAVAARRAGKSFSLAQAGNLIAKTPGRASLTGGLIGSGLGEAVVADEDIGTFADMAQGTSLEPLAITMMNRDETLKGRQDAMRKLVNRLKFGTEGALFNLALVGAGKGIQKLRNPKDGLDQFSKDKLKAFGQRYGEFGFTAKGMMKEAAFEAKESSKGIQKAVSLEASNLVNALESNLRSLGDTFYDGYLKNSGLKTTDTAQAKVLEDIKNIISPKDFKAERILKSDLAKQRLKDMKPVFQYKDLQKKLIDLAAVKSKTLGDKALDDLLRELRDDFKALKTRYPNIEDMVKSFDEKGIFQVKDLTVTKELDNLLKQVESSAGKEVADQLKGNIFDMRLAVDNMSARLLQRQMPEEVASAITENFGRYLNTSYKAYDQKGLFGLWKYKPTQEIIDQSEEIFTNSELAKLGREASPEDLVRIKKDARDKVEEFMRKMGDDEFDPITARETNIGKEELKEVQIRDSILEKRAVQPWQKHLLGEIKDPSYTFFATVGKQANLNATLSYMDDIAKMGTQGDNPFVIDPEKIVRSRIESAKKELTSEQALRLTDDPNALKEFEGAIKKNVQDELGYLDTTKWRKVENAAKVPTPLDGKYIKAPMYEDIFDASNNWLNMTWGGQFYKTVVLAPKAGSQIAKTILSPLTHVRNALSAGAFVAANGAFFPTYGDFKMLAPKMLGGEAIYKDAWGISGRRIFGTMTEADEVLYKKLLKVGVVDSQVQASETKRLFRDMFKDPSVVDKSLVTRVPQKVGSETRRKLLKGYAKLQDAYVAEDDFWKIINWNLERNRYSQIVDQLGVTQTNFKHLINKDLPQQLTETSQDFALRQLKAKEAVEALGENGTKIADYFSKLAKRRDYIDSGLNSTEQFSNFLDEIAGNLTRNQVPNYGYVGKTARALRQSPFGNFIAFPIEIMRTGNNILQRSIDDIASGIPEIQKLGYKRLSSFGATVVGVPAAMVGAGKAYHDVDDKEMDALRRIVPEWSKNSTLIPMGRDKNGYLQYIDFSYSNAYDTLIRPVMAVYRGLAESGENEKPLTAALGSGMMDSMSEILKPYATESIYTEALIDAVFRLGVGKGGRRVWSEEDDFGQKLFKGVSHVATSLTPGSLSQFKRLAQSATGVTDDYGRSFNLSDEIHGLYGMRVMNSDPERALKYMTTSFGSSLKKDYNLFIAPLLKGGRVTPEEIIKRYGYSESRRFNTMKEMYKNIQAMETLGMKKFKIRNEIESRKGIKREIIDEVLQGVYTPQYPSTFFIEKMGEINRELNRTEGVKLPNPYFKALPFISKVIRKNRRLSLKDELFSMPDLEMPDYRSTLDKKVSRLTSSITGNTATPQNYNLDSGIVSAFNQGTGTDQVSPVTGLTYVEDSLLKPWEKILKQKERTT